MCTYISVGSYTRNTEICTTNHFTYCRICQCAERYATHVRLFWSMEEVSQVSESVRKPYDEFCVSIRQTVQARERKPYTGESFVGVCANYFTHELRNETVHGTVCDSLHCFLQTTAKQVSRFVRRQTIRKRDSEYVFLVGSCADKKTWIEINVFLQ